jgi:hypothetical protein
LIVGSLSKEWGSLREATMILPVALMVGAVLWLWLALRMRRGLDQRSVSQVTIGK